MISPISLAKTGSMVPTNLSRTCTIWAAFDHSSQIKKLVLNNPLLVISNGIAKIVKMYSSASLTYNISNTNQKWTKIKGSTCSIWWYVFFIRADNCLDSFYEHVCRNLWHQDDYMYVADVWHFHQDGTVEHCHP